MNKKIGSNQMSGKKKRNGKSAAESQYQAQQAEAERARVAAEKAAAKAGKSVRFSGGKRRNNTRRKRK